MKCDHVDIIPGSCTAELVVVQPKFVPTQCVQWPCTWGKEVCMLINIGMSIVCIQRDGVLFMCRDANSSVLCVGGAFSV